MHWESIQSSGFPSIQPILMVARYEFPGWWASLWTRRVRLFWQIRRAGFVRWMYRWGSSSQWIYAPSNHSGRLDLFRRIESFLTTSRRLLLAGDWNALLDIDLDRIGTNSGTNNRDVKAFQEFIDKSDLVDKYRNEHPREIVLIWRIEATPLRRCVLAVSTDF